MLNGILLMDLHWGAIPPERMKMELEETLYKYIESLNNLNMIVIGGDLFDSKQYFSSDVIQYVLEFIDDLLRLTYTSNTQLYIIKGTRTHDDLQLQTLKSVAKMCKYHQRIHIIEEVYDCRLTDIKDVDVYHVIWYPLDKLDMTEDELGEDDMIINVLFLPEEYIIDQNEYYKDTLYNEDKHYDLIFGHGMIDKIWYAQHGQDADFKQHSAPVFKVDDLERASNYSYFGHIHEHKKYGKNKSVEYVGPYTRWEFGKEAPVGFVYFEYDEINKTCREEFVENPMAQVLKTIPMNIKEDIDLSTLNDKIDDIIAKEMTRSEKLRFIVNLNSKLPNFLAIKDFIISKISNIKFVKLTLCIDVDDEEMEHFEEKMTDINMRLNSLYDQNSSLEEQIRTFLKQKRNIDISIEDIKSVLFDQN